MDLKTNLLISPDDKQILHDLAHLTPKLYRKWVALNSLVPTEIKNKHFSFYRDMETYMNLVSKLGAAKNA